MELEVAFAPICHDSNPAPKVLEALVTYMYHGTVSVPQHRLQSFLQTAEALKIKGIVDTSSDSPAPLAPPPRPPTLTGPGLAALPRAPQLQPLQVSSSFLCSLLSALCNT